MACLAEVAAAGIVQGAGVGACLGVIVEGMDAAGEEVRRCSSSVCTVVGWHSVVVEVEGCLRHSEAVAGLVLEVGVEEEVVGLVVPAKHVAGD